MRNYYFSYQYEIKTSRSLSYKRKINNQSDTDYVS